MLFLYSGFLLHGLDLPRQIRFDPLTTREGLSSSSVSGILQDKDGIIWIATQAGLNRYDGYSFTYYENDPFNRNSLSHNLIQTIYLDEAGIIWLGTYGGLNRFDPESGDFDAYIHDARRPDSLSNNVVVAITRDRAGNLWVGTLDGLNRLDTKTGSFTRYYPDPDDPSSVPDKVIRTLLVDDFGQLWIGSYGGLSRYLPETDAFEQIPMDTAGDGNGLPSPYVMSLCRNKEDPSSIFVGTWDGGISSLDVLNGRIHHYPIPSEMLYQIMNDSKGRIWAATWGDGLIVLNPENGETIQYRDKEYSVEQKGLSHNVVYSLFEDDSGIIWIGTNGGGVNKYVEWSNRYRFIVNESGNPNSLSEGKVTSILEDEDGSLWIGVYSGGLNHYDPLTGMVRRYGFDKEDAHSLSDNIVNVLFRDRADHLWIGTNNGLNHYLPDSDRFERIYADGSDRTPPESIIYTMTEDRKGNLWIGTNSSGAAVKKAGEERFVNYAYDAADPTSLSDNLVRTVFEDSHGMLWIGTNNGLNRYHADTGTFSRYYHDPDRPQTLSSDNIRVILEDSSGTLWIATAGGGLNRYNRKDDSFSAVSRKDGLLSNHILAMVERNPGELWLSTNRGLCIYNVEQGTFRTIDAENGLLTSELTTGLTLGRSENLYVGGVRGVTIIDREDTSGDPYIPPLVVTHFEVLGEERKLLKSGDKSYKELLLSPSDKLFSLQVAALDYSSPERNQYAFMLEGFDDSLIYSGTRNYVRYTNIDPGRYTLRIIGAGSRGNWNETGLAIPIRVLPPWWLSPPAFAAYMLVSLLFVLLLVNHYRIRRQRLEERYAEQERINRELDQKVKERTAEIEKARKVAEEATKAKSLFLANMSHEIRTPLTGMLGMFSLLAKTKLNQNQRSFLDYSRTAAENLNQLVNDLLDVESIESGTLPLHETRFDPEKALAYVYHLFEERAKSQGLDFFLDIEAFDPSLEVLGDQNRFIQIVTNLVSNALKYTESGSISLKLTVTPVEVTSAEAQKRQSYTVVVSDTGIGIPKDKTGSIFESFTQLDTGYAKSSKGVGLGLAIVKQLVDAMEGTISVESSPDGTSFTVGLSFPVAPPQEEAEMDRKTASDDNSGIGKILVCEDEGINRFYLGTLLRNKGFAVDVAANGREAVELAESDDYSLILMDLGMPEIDGLEATRMIRAQGITVPIIALTAHSYREDIDKCREAGMDDFLAKPILEPLLFEKIRTWVGDKA